MLDLLAHDTGIWITISFFLFLFVAFKLGRKSIIGGLDSRINEVKNEIETAERLRVEAQELLAQYQRKQRDAEQEAQDILSRAEKQAAAMAQNAESELQETMIRRESQLTDRLKRLEENAIAKIQSHAADLAVNATREVISQTLDTKSNTALNEATIVSLPKTLN